MVTPSTRELKRLIGAVIAEYCFGEFPSRSQGVPSYFGWARFRVKSTIMLGFLQTSFKHSTVNTFLQCLLMCLTLGKSLPRPGSTLQLDLRWIHLCPPLREFALLCTLTILLLCLQLRVCVMKLRRAQFNLCAFLDEPQLPHDPTFVEKLHRNENGHGHDEFSVEGHYGGLTPFDFLRERIFFE